LLLLLSSADHFLISTPCDLIHRNPVESNVL